MLADDGYLTGPDGDRHDAIGAEALDAEGQITVMAQRYQPGTMLRSFDTVGNAVLLPNDWSKLGD